MPWSDDELRIAVETYRFLLRLEHSGQTCSENELVTLLRGGLLVGRKQSSIRYRLRNISAILAERGQTTLGAYSPAPRAGTQVKARLEAMLFTDVPVSYSIAGLASSPTTGTAPEKALEQAEVALKAALNEFEHLHPASTRIGHNKPPEPIDELTPDDFRNAILALQTTRIELTTSRLTAEAAAQRAKFLTRLGIRIAAWAGERFTKALDAGLDAGTRLAARLCVLALFASLPPVATAVDALVRLAAG